MDRFAVDVARGSERCNAIGGWRAPPLQLQLCWYQNVKRLCDRLATDDRGRVLAAAAWPAQIRDLDSVKAASFE